MARTIIGVNDAKAVKRYSGKLTVETGVKSFFNSRLMGRGATAETPIQVFSDLESDAGEQITYDLLAELTMAPVEGEDTLEGKEERQRFYTDTIYIDQARVGGNIGGRMTRKRTLHNLREKMLMQQSSWWARFYDELLFVYLSGARGVNDYLLKSDFSSFAGNSLKTPDSNHVVYGDNAGSLATSDATITTSHKMTLAAIGRAKIKADVQGGGTSGIPYMLPCKVDGKEVHVMVMHKWQEDDLRASTATGDWLDLQKAAAGATGDNSHLFKDSLGMHRNVILQSHKNVVRFSTWGSGSNVAGARALFLGAQAGVVAFGSPGTGMRFDWHEETRDNGDKVVITSSAILGVKKSTFTTEAGQQDFGVFAVDTAAASR